MSDVTGPRVEPQMFYSTYKRVIARPTAGQFLSNFSVLLKFHLAPSRAYWIGLRRMPDTNDFVWADGTRLQNGDFAPWWETEPDNIDLMENCVVMGHPCCDSNITGYQWFDIFCSAAFSGQATAGFICQRLSSNVLVSVICSLLRVVTR